MCSVRGINRLADLGGPGHVCPSKYVTMRMGHHDVDRVSGSDLLAVDDERDVHHLRSLGF